VVIGVEQWAEIRRMHRVEGLSIREIHRRTGLHRKTIRRALASQRPPAYRRAPVGSKLDPGTLGEVKRRTKVIGRFPGEESCLSLVWAVLDLQINNACNGVKLSHIDRHASTGCTTSQTSQRTSERRWPPPRLTRKGAKPRRSYSSFGTRPWLRRS
jgi:hypothetical protein